MTLKTRLKRLENEYSGASRVIVIDGPEGLDADAALRNRGIHACDRDLIVVIADPVATTDTITVTVDGRATSVLSARDEDRSEALPQLSQAADLEIGRRAAT